MVVSNNYHVVIFFHTLDETSRKNIATTKSIRECGSGLLAGRTKLLDRGEDVVVFAIIVHVADCVFQSVLDSDGYATDVPYPIFTFPNYYNRIANFLQNM